jgi:uncharacterized phiE125 gp8 family phage protein
MALSPGYGETLLTAPTWEPLTVSQVVSQSRLLAQEADAELIGAFITAAREWLEERTQRAIPQQQWEYSFDQFPGRQVDDYRPPTWRYGIFRLSRPPLISVDYVKYIADTANDPPFVYTTLATTEYQVDATTEPGRLAPAPYKVWPTTNALAMGAIKVGVTCGWPTADKVPARIKQALRLLVAHLHENREGTIEEALQALPYGIEAFASSCATWEYT